MSKIITELCQNHNGSREILTRQIKAAADAGADYIKGQIIFSDDLTHRSRFDGGIVEHNGIRKAIDRPYDKEYARLKKLDLTDDDYKWFIEECQRNNAIPLITIFSRKRIELASKLPWPEKIVKVANFDCSSYPFLKELTDVFDHLIVSTGCSTDEEIAKAAEIVRGAGKKLTLLHCVSIYPNALIDCNLARMKFLKQFADSIGWSDHTLVERDGIKAAKVALALGANFIERHFTVLKKDETKDGPVSITPELLKELVDFSRLSAAEKKKIVCETIPEWQTIVGVQTRHMTHQEALNADYFRGRFASLVNGEWVYNWEDKPVF